MVKKSDASENVQKLERNGNTRSNGHSIGGDTLAMGLCFRVFKFKSAAENLQGHRKIEREARERQSIQRFLFQFIHDDVPRRHHNMVDLDIW